MLPNIQTILYATDLSDLSRQAFGYAASLANRYDAELKILHVIEPVNPSTYAQISGAMGEADWSSLQMEYENSIVDNLGARLRQFCHQMEITFEEIKIRNENILIRKGVSVDQILATASREKADIIVMGTHGYGMVKDALMGGTARRIVRRSTTPVLVIRSSQENE